MLRTSTLTLVALLSIACAPTTSARPVALTAASGTSETSTTSVAQVGRYRLTRSELMRPTVRDSIYRFTDGTPATVSVIRYDVPAFLKSEPDSQGWTTREGERFEEVQLVLMQQGRIQNFEKVFSTTRDVPVDDGMLREMARRTSRAARQ